MAFRKDIHSGGIQSTNQIVTSDLSGGLNLLDNPLTVGGNELTVADNVQYTPTGYAIETRDPLSSFLGTDGSVIPKSSEVYIFNAYAGVMYGSAGDSVYSFPSSRPGYSTDLLMCSDFTWFVCGVYRCNEIPERCSEFVASE